MPKELQPQDSIQPALPEANLTEGVKTTLALVQEVNGENHSNGRSRKGYVKARGDRRMGINGK